MSITLREIVRNHTRTETRLGIFNFETLQTEPYSSDRLKNRIQCRAYELSRDVAFWIFPITDWKHHWIDNPVSTSLVKEQHG